MTLPHFDAIPVEFILFALTLAGVAFFHHRTLQVALAGLAVIASYKLAVTGFKTGEGLEGLIGHLGHESVGLLNLLALLTGFALLSRHFEESHVPGVMPAVLPDDWRGGLVLLGLVFVLSAFLDNIAAAIIGGTVARAVYQGRVHIGYLAGIVAASNGGGSGSVVGDTTTTMMWISGISPLTVLPAYIAAAASFAVFAIPVSRWQHELQPITKDADPQVSIDGVRLAIVAVILLAAIGANVAANLAYPEILAHVPVIGVAVWGAILVTALLRAPDWSVLPETLKSTVFLLSLVLSASLMPVDALPPASWGSTLGLGFVSAVFDNIPLTALALKQGGYDWGLLAYAVGFGGSMLWFGSSAGVALATMFPEARSVSAWVRSGWPVAFGYVIGFFVMLALWGWQP